MKKNKITQHLSLRAKFKDSKTIELVIMNDLNEIQIELIPIKLTKFVGNAVPEDEDSVTEEKDEEEDVK